MKLLDISEPAMDTILDRTTVSLQRSFEPKKIKGVTFNAEYDSKMIRGTADYRLLPDSDTRRRIFNWYRAAAQYFITREIITYGLTMRLPSEKSYRFGFLHNEISNVRPLYDTYCRGKEDSSFPPLGLLPSTEIINANQLKYYVGVNRYLQALELELAELLVLWQDYSDRHTKAEKILEALAPLDALCLAEDFTLPSEEMIKESVLKAKLDSKPLENQFLAYLDRVYNPLNQFFNETEETIYTGKKHVSVTVYMLFILGTIAAGCMACILREYIRHNAEKIKNYLLEH